MKRNHDHEGYKHLFFQSSVSENPSILEYYAEMIGKFWCPPPSVTFPAITNTRAHTYTHNLPFHLRKSPKLRILI